MSTQLHVPGLSVSKEEKEDKEEDTKGEAMKD
jgi:hypothetical protein